MINNSLKSVILLFVVFIPTCLFSQSNINQAIDFFNNNKLNDAARVCDDVIKTDKASAKDALLIKVLINLTYNDTDNAFKNLKQFLDGNEHINDYLFALWNSQIFFSYDNDDFIDFLEELSNSKNIDITMRAWINEKLFNHYFENYSFSKAGKYAEKLGCIYDWQAVGEFENISESGFDKTFDPISKPEPATNFTDKSGAEVQWFNLVKPYNGKWIDLQQYFYTRNSIIYCQTFCKSDQDRVCQYRIGTSGSLKVWVNDKLAMSEDDERNNGIDTYVADIKLHKGINRILLQIGSSEIDRNNFLSRITDKSGEVLKDLSFSTKYEPYTVEKDYVAKMYENSYEEYFKNQVAKNPDKILNYLMLGDCYMMGGNMPEARETFKKAQKLAPISTFIFTRLIEIYQQMNNKTDMSIANEKILQNDPESLYSLDYLFQEAVENDKLDDAKKYYEKYKKITTENANLLLMGISLAGKEKNVTELLEKINEAFDKFPENGYVRYLKYLILTDQNDIQQAIKLSKKSVKEKNYLSYVSKLASLYQKNGNIDEYMDLYDGIFKYYPNDITTFYDYARSMFAASKYKEAEKYFRKCVEIAPYVSDYHEELGNTFKEEGRNEEAAKEYNTCLKYNKYAFDVIDKLRLLEKKKSIYDYFETPNLADIYTKSLKDSVESGTNAVVLLDQSNKILFPGGASEELNYHLVKVMTTEGVDSYKEYYIPIHGNQRYLIDKAEVLKSDGSKIKAEINDDQVVFPNLQPKDAISITYRIKNFQFGSLSKYYFDFYEFADYDPCKVVKYCLLTTPDTKFDYKMVNSTLQPTTKKVEDYVMYEWTSKDVPAIKHEPCMQTLTDICPSLVISSIPDWKSVSQWYYDIYRRKAKDDYEVTQAVNEIFPTGWNDVTDYEKAKRVYEYIVKNIRYSHVPFRQSGIIPQKASKVLNTKLGDCKDVATLFVALCNKVGLKPHIALVSTTGNGKNHLQLPSLNFDHAIAIITLDGKKRFIELTSNALTFNTIPPEVCGATALEILPDSVNELVSIPKNEDLLNTTVRKIDVNINDMDLKIAVENIKKGDDAAHTRMNYGYKNAEDQKKRLTNFLSYEYKKFKLNDLSFDGDLTTLTDSVDYHYSFTASDEINKISKFYSFKPPFQDRLFIEDVNLETRKYPFEMKRFYGSDQGEEYMTIHIPQGRQMAEPIESREISNDFVDFKINYEQEGNELHIYKYVSFKKAMVNPEEYDQFKGFVEQIKKYEETPVVLQEGK